MSKDTPPDPSGSPQGPSTEETASSSSEVPTAHGGEARSEASPTQRPTAPAPGSRSTGGRLVRLLRRVLILAVVGVAAYVAWWMLTHRPAARRRPPKPKATLVEVTGVARGPARVSVTVMGVVKPSREIGLHAQVVGKVSVVHRQLVPGGLIPKGEVLLRIEPDDYVLSVKQAEGALAQAQAALDVEKGRQVVVRRELELLGASGKGVNPALVLREPQLRTAEAAVAMAQAALRKARLDLLRTRIRAPWNGVVVSRAVDVGSRVTALMTLLRLVGTDSYWVELVVPMDQLRHVRFPGTGGEEGARVLLRDPTNWGLKGVRHGQIRQLLPDLEEKGRLGRVLVEVQDPLSLEPGSAGAPRLQLGAYLQAEIQGKELPDMITLERRWLRDRDKVWVLGRNNRLVIRPVTLAHRGREQVLVSGGLEPGEQVVTSDLVAPVQGMLLKVAGPRASGGPVGASPMDPRSAMGGAAP